jgi:hypothetical protein
VDEIPTGKFQTSPIFRARKEQNIKGEGSVHLFQILSNFS